MAYDGLPSKQQTYRERLWARGLCTQCAKVECDTWRCPGCMGKLVAQRAARRVERIAKGLCGKCGKRPLRTKSQCDPCSKLHARRTQTYRKEGPTFGGPGKPPPPPPGYVP